MGHERAAPRIRTILAFPTLSAFGCSAQPPSTTAAAKATTQIRYNWPPLIPSINIPALPSTVHKSRHNRATCTLTACRKPSLIALTPSIPCCIELVLHVRLLCDASILAAGTSLAAVWHSHVHVCTTPTDVGLLVDILLYATVCLTLTQLTHSLA